MDYEQRQFYRGPEAYVDLPARPKRDRRAHRRGAGRTSRQRRTARRGGAGSRRRSKVVAVLQIGEAITVTGDGLKPVTSGLSDKAEPEDADPPRRGRPRGARRQGRLVADAVARGRGRFRRARPEHRRDPRAGRRLRLRQEQVQPRHAGLAPAGLELQAVHLLGGAGKGLHAGDGHQRRAACSSTPAPPAASPGSRRTTTASSTARCRCAPRWPSRRTWSRSASCSRSARPSRRNGSRASASKPTSTRPT